MYCNVTSSDHVIQTFRKNTNINKKIIKKKCSPKSFWNYCIGMTSLNQTWSAPCPQPRKCMVHALMSMKDTASCHAEFSHLAVLIQRINVIYLWNLKCGSRDGTTTRMVLSKWRYVKNWYAEHEGKWGKIQYMKFFFFLCPVKWIRCLMNWNQN